MGHQKVNFQKLLHQDLMPFLSLANITTADCNQGRARDLLNQDRDETETLKSETRPRGCSFRDVGRDREAPETLESLESFNVSPRRFPWRMV